jgi:hypothetical protein
MEALVSALVFFLDAKIPSSVEQILKIELFRRFVLFEGGTGAFLNPGAVPVL